MNNVRDELAGLCSQVSEPMLDDSPLLWIGSCVVGAAHSPSAALAADSTWYDFETTVHREALCPDRHR